MVTVIIHKRVSMRVFGVNEGVSKGPGSFLIRRDNACKMEVNFVSMQFTHVFGHTGS